MTRDLLEQPARGDLADPDEVPCAAYDAFLRAKTAIAPACGLDIDESDIHPLLKPHQRALVKWSVRLGRAAIFADTGLGKTFMQLEWARLIGQRTLILAPLSVARQTVREALRLGAELAYARDQAEAGPITITNYEMAQRFDPQAFGAVVLDESSILKATDGATRNALIAMFRNVPYRLCCTATPAPNDIQELTNHAEFLSVARRRDVLATYFLHDSADARASGWRLKGHARQAFWRWLSSWGMSLKKPSDLGFADDGYVLPPLQVLPVEVQTDYRTPGKLFADRLRGVTERASIRRQTATARVEAAVRLIDGEPRQSWIAWCGLNDEQDAVTGALGSKCISVYGTMPPEQKAELLEAWQDGAAPVLATKVTVAGFGMNLQRAARQVFVGLNDSYEQYYQAIRRSWRFGQDRPVKVYVVIAECERPIYDNVLRKEREAEEMSAELIRHVVKYEREAIGAAVRSDTAYAAHTALQLPAWLS